MKMPKSVWWLVIGMALNITGSSFLWPLNTIYMNDVLHKSLTMAGLVLMVNSIGMVIGNLLGGTMFDKLGGYRTIMIGTTICLISTILLNFYHGWPWYAIWLVALGFGGGMIVPAIYAMAGAVWPNGGRQTFNAIYLAQNLGVAIGAASGGFVAELSFNYIFIANLLMYVLFAIVATTQFNLKLDVKVKSSEALSLFSKSYRLYFKALIALCVLFSICWVAYIQWESTIASFTQNLNISMGQYSLLWTVNGILILVAQPLIYPLIRLMKENIRRQMFVGVCIFIVSFFVTSFAEQFSIFMIGMVILTIGEMFVWPAVPAIANSLAPDGKAGSFQGYVNSAATIGKAIGPLLGGMIVDLYGMQKMFLSMILLLLFAIICIFVLNYYLNKIKAQ
ncbi:MFS transporter [Staphylococcus sp. ACRSN]|uniref:MDR family MFS transporter n=1 Tax=Staphylococcus sp. ACRSN TaxID=2918214 RepID=UPI001EF223E3|nr:MFS transporter [Staphylococcus sp. ACRSN]MCG7338404.1 MFS transporter [Staphylococcus sp. ACRSN]